MFLSAWKLKRYARRGTDMNKGNKIKFFGALIGAILAVIIQKKTSFNQDIKTLIIAFLPWILAELFNLIYEKISKNDISGDLK